MLGRGKKNAIVVLAIFIFAFCWQLFFTYGFDFFWEDFGIYHLDKDDSVKHKFYYEEEHSLDAKNLSRSSLLSGILRDFMKKFFTADRLFQIGFSGFSRIGRPYTFLTFDLLKVTMGDKVILHRILKSIIFAVTTCILFLIIKRASVLLALLGAFLYMTSAEIWLSVLYTHFLAPFAQCGIILSIMLFIKLTEKPNLRYKDTLFYYFLIMLASNYAVLTTSDGRYLAIIFFLTILLFRRKEIRFHLPMLFILLLMEIPVLGCIKKVFCWNSSFTPIDIASHSSDTTKSNLESLKIALTNYKFPQYAIGNFLLMLLCIIIVIHLLYLVLRKNTAVSKKIQPLNPIFKERLFLFTLWFIATLAMSARARNFCYDGPHNFQLLDLSYFIAPFIISLSYYVSLVSSSIKKPYSAIILAVCISLMGAQIVSNTLRLNQFRGGWGNYFCAWKNVEKYIDAHSNNAMVYTSTEMFYKPFAFRHSNNKVMNNYPGSFNLGFIEKAFEEKGYSDIFLARRFGLEVEGESKKVILKNTTVIDGNSGDLYDRLKLIIGRGSRPVIYVYHFVYNKGD